jgi:gliding motility-associated-like protein
MMSVLGRFAKFFSFFLIFTFGKLFITDTFAQDAFIGYNYETKAYPLAWWISPPTATIFNAGTSKEVKIEGLGGSVTSGTICSSVSNNINHYYLGGSTQYVEITIPQNDISQFLIELTGSTNNSSGSIPGIVYSTEIPFNPNNCFTWTTPSPFPAVSGSWTKIKVLPPNNAKSLRIYRSVYFGSGTMSTSSGSGRVLQGGAISLRLASIAVWSTGLPTSQTKNINFNNVSTTGMDVSFTRGNGSKVVVFAKEGSGLISNPIDNTIYTANADWAKGNPLGSPLGSSGYYCVYNGNGNSFSLTNLKVNTNYTLQAFEYNGSFTDFKFLTTSDLGNPASQATKPLSAPTVQTNTITNILSNKAFCGGTIPDSGGVAISQKGLVWSTSSNPTTISNSGKLILGSQSQAFSGYIKGLTPLTKYYVRAYAINSIGISYGDEKEFTTAAAAPVLTALPSVIDFGENYFNGTPITISYTLSGNNLSPASGNITITAPVGFLISKNGNSGFSNAITLPYYSSILKDIPIYVQLPVTSYGTFKGDIIHSGGGTSTIDADVVSLSGAIVQSIAELSNKGSDFWLGFGYQEKMSQKSGDASEAKMSIYVTTGEQSATVHTELTSGGYSKTQYIAPNSTFEFKDFPTGDPANNTNAGGFPDARLFATGVSKKSVHIYTDNGVPVNVFLHTYTDANSAAGAMIFPSNTWNSSYKVQAFGGLSNNSNPNSFFFVIANEDNTEVSFSPTQSILDASSSSLFKSTATTTANTAYAAGGTYTVKLNKGEVFNAMGAFGNGNLGLDLSGTTIKTNCDKKIAVFGGNGRVLVNSFGCTPSSGSDHLIQQMFPSVAWGTKYLTVPTKTMEFNYFRIYIDDPSTIVKVNGVALATSSLINNLYYQYQSSQPALIESNRPINVSQFILSASCATINGSKGTGDPEMIILSPVQQSITNATVYSAAFKGTSASPPVKPALANGTLGNCASYINVVIPKDGVADFKLDGQSVADIGVAAPAATCTTGNCIAFSASNSLIPMNQAFKPHPQDPNFYMATFWVSTASTHTLSSSIGFNAIAYGMGNGESYGYNAGTAIKNLSSIKFAQNPLGVDTSTTIIKVGRNNLVTLKIALPYNPFLVDSITWDSSFDSRISPSVSKVGSTDISTGKAKYEGTIDVNGQTFYIYQSPSQYLFSEDGIYRVNAKASGTFAGDCGGIDNQRVSILVGRDNLNFEYNTACGSPIINFVNNTIAMPGTTINSWNWDFGDATSSNLKDPPSHTYSLTNGKVYHVKLTTTNSIGVISKDSIIVDFSGGVEAAFTPSAKAICSGGTVSFDPSASQITGSTSGIPSKWIWKFGDGDSLIVNGPSSPVQIHKYINPGKYTVKLTLISSTACANTFVDTIKVGTSPRSAILAQSTACLKDLVSYQDKSTISVGSINAWFWTFDDGTTSTLQNPVHQWLTPGKHKVTLRTNSLEGCASVDTASHEINILALPIANFNTNSPYCKGQKVVFNNTSIPGSIDAPLAGFIWDFGDGSPLVTRSVIDTLSHVFVNEGTYKVKLLAKNNFGCVSDTIYYDIKINPVPAPDFNISEICTLNKQVQFKATNNSAAIVNSWIWDFGDGNTLTGQDVSHTYTTGGNYVVKLTANTLDGCGSFVTKNIKVYNLPTTAFSIDNELKLCSALPVKVTNKSALVGFGNIVKIELFWDYLNNPTAFVSINNPTINALCENTYPNPITALSVNYRILMRAYNENGCFTEAFSDIVIHAMPTAVFNALPNVCEDSLPFAITGASEQRGLSGIGVYSGLGISSSPIFSPKQAGPGLHQITYTFTSSYGCVTTETQTILVHPAPVIDLGTQIIYIKENESKILSPKLLSGEVTKYTWSPSLYLDNSNSPNPVCSPLNDIIYQLIGESANGCKDTAFVVVNILREIIAPNTFTPNGDNVNDLWVIKYFSSYPGARVNVFNRYGKKVFSSYSDNLAWDGKLNGVDLPEGTYYYIIDPKNGDKLITGSVTILR